MSDMPERIWAFPEGEFGYYNDKYKTWSETEEYDDGTEYVRSDIHRNLAIGAIAAETQVADAYAAQLKAEAECDIANVAKGRFQKMTLAHWTALCAMRNDINEYISMPNTDSGPLFHPENGPIYADIAERVVGRVKEDREYILGLEAELKDRSSKIDEALARADTCNSLMRKAQRDHESAETALAAERAKVARLVEAIELIESVTVNSGGEIHGVTMEHYRTAYESMRQEASIVLDEIGYGVSKADARDE